MKKPITMMLCAVLCIVAACALDAGGGNTQTAQTDTAGAGTMNITITVNGKTLTASLYDNSSARALVGSLKKGAVLSKGLNG